MHMWRISTAAQAQDACCLFPPLPLNHQVYGRPARSSCRGRSSLPAAEPQRAMTASLLPTTWRPRHCPYRTTPPFRTAASSSSSSSTPSLTTQEPKQAEDPAGSGKNAAKGETASESSGDDGTGRKRTAVGVILRTILSLAVTLMRLGALSVLVYWAFGERVVQAAQWLGLARSDIIPWAVGLWLMGWVQKGLVHIKRFGEALVVQNGRAADRVLQPGWHWIVPSQEHICDGLSSRRTKMIPSRRYVTKDDKDVRMSSTIHYSVFSRHGVNIPTWMEDKVMEDVAAASHAALREAVDELTQEEAMQHDWGRVGRTLVDNINTIGGNFQIMATKQDVKIASE